MPYFHLITYSIKICKVLNYEISQELMSIFILKLIFKIILSSSHLLYTGTLNDFSADRASRLELILFIAQSIFI